MEHINDPTITEASAPQYPDWQATIRRGQATVAAMLEQERETLLSRLAAEDAQRGKLLAEALSLFNIHVSTPSANQVVLDGIAFSVRTAGNYDRSTPPTLINQDRFSDEWAYSFDLEVSYALQGKYATAQVDYDNYSMFKTLGIRHRVNDDDWTQEHHQLAEAIDYVTQNGKAFMAKVDSWQDAPPFVSPPSLSQQLESILREIVRDELMKQDSIDYGYED